MSVLTASLRATVKNILAPASCNVVAYNLYIDGLGLDGIQGGFLDDG